VGASDAVGAARPGGRGALAVGVDAAGSVDGARTASDGSGRSVSAGASEDRAPVVAVGSEGACRAGVCGLDASPSAAGAGLGAPASGPSGFTGGRAGCGCAAIEGAEERSAISGDADVASEGGRETGMLAGNVSNKAITAAASARPSAVAQRAKPRPGRRCRSSTIRSSAIGAPSRSAKPWSSSAIGPVRPCPLETDAGLVADAVRMKLKAGRMP